MRGRSRYLDGTGLTSLLRNQSQRSLVKSVQYGTVVLTNVDEATATITAVNTDNAILVFLGASGSATTNINRMLTRVALTNATTVTGTRGNGTNAMTIAFVVIEFQPGVIKRVQRGTITIGSAAASNTDTITSVNTAKAVAIYLGHSSSNTGIDDSDWLRMTLTDATTVTATRGDTTGTLIVSYQVVEFY